MDSIKMQLHEPANPVIQTVTHVLDPEIHNAPDANKAHTTSKGSVQKKAIVLRVILLIYTYRNVPHVLKDAIHAWLLILANSVSQDGH